MNSAFTLIELLIVVAIIGILVGIGVPALRNSRQNAINAKVATITAQVATAKTRYILDNGSVAFDAATDATRFNSIAPYILVNGVPVVVANDLLKGLPSTVNSILVDVSGNAPQIVGNTTW